MNLAPISNTAPWLSAVASATNSICHPLDNEQTVALVSTKEHFADGDPFSIYVRPLQDGFEFFDDGQTFLHFRGRGLRFTRDQVDAFALLAHTNGVTLTEGAQFQVQDASPTIAFEKLRGCLMSVREWELQLQQSAQEKKAIRAGNVNFGAGTGQRKEQ